MSIKNITQFTIYRSHWKRPGLQDKTKTFLANNTTGLKCCVGFYMLACGVYPKHIKNRRSPEVMYFRYPDITGLLSKTEHGYQNSDMVNELMFVNDDEEITDAEREIQIQKLFKQQGITVIFKDSQGVK
jgi:hypothetical protein